MTKHHFLKDDYYQDAPEEIVRERSAMQKEQVMTNMGEKGSTYYVRPGDLGGRNKTGDSHVVKGTRQSYQPGDKVKIGFVKDLNVEGPHPHGGVHLTKGDKHYQFMPYGGGLMKSQPVEHKSPIRESVQLAKVSTEQLAKTAEALRHVGAGKAHGET